MKPHHILYLLKSTGIELSEGPRTKAVWPTAQLERLVLKYHPTHTHTYVTMPLLYLPVDMQSRKNMITKNTT